MAVAFEYMSRPIAEYVLYTLVLAFNFLAPRAFVAVGGWEVYVSALLMLGAYIVLPPARFPRNPKRNVAIGAFLALMLYGIASLVWSSSPYHAYYRISPLLNASLTVLLAVRLAGGLRGVDRLRVLHNATSLLVLATLLRALSNPASPTGGWSRLETQMGGASVLHLPLLIALALYFYSVRTGYRTWLSAGLLGVTILLIFMTGSRAGVASMALLLILLILRVAKPRLVLPAAGGLAGLTYIAFLNLPTDRLLDFQDSLRSVNAGSAFKAAFETTTSTLIGQGIGTLWPWYYRLAAGTEQDLFVTRHGLFLRNPHSTPVGVLAELGILGASLLALSLGVIAFSALRHYIGRTVDLAGAVGIAMVISMASFFVEYHLLSNFAIAFFWWLYAIFIVDDPGEPLRADAARESA